MSFTEEQKVFIKEKINKILPGSKIYLFGAYGSEVEVSIGIALYVITERDPSLREKEDILSSLCIIMGNKDLNVSYYRNNLESVSKEVRYALIEGIEL